MKILVIDIETSPIVGYTWSTWNTNVIKILHPTRMLCFAAKWVGDNRIMYWSEHAHGREVMVGAACGLLDEADAVVHYNGKSFDVRHLNREIALAGLTPPSPFAQIDLLQTVRKRFRFDQNRLKDVTAAFGVEEKAQHEGFGLWEKCLAGDAKAWREMRKYNRQDVVATEALYHRLLPWIPNHPNRRLYDPEANGCPTCGSSRLHRQGFAYTKLSKFQRWSCLDCGSWFRSSARDSGVEMQGVAP